MTNQQTSDEPTTGGQLLQVLGDLEHVVRSVNPAGANSPTPCPEFTVSDLERHVLGWLMFFAAAAADPTGATTRPDPKAHPTPTSAARAAEDVENAASTLREALASGVADSDVVLTQGPMPGAAAISLILWEYIVHGWDIARATGQPWNPPTAAVASSLDFAQQMLTPEWRGSDFGDPVSVAADAPVLDRLLGFTGRDPEWQAR